MTERMRGWLKPTTESGRLLLSSAGTVGASTYSQLLLLISGPLVARMLGVEGRGYFAGLTLWSLVISLLGNMGVPIAATYFMSQRPRESRRILGEAYRIGGLQIVLLTALLAAVLALWTDGKPPEVRTAAWAVLLMMPASLVQQYTFAVLQSQGRFKAFNIYRVLGPTLYTIAEATLFLSGNQSLVPVVLAWVVAYAIPAAIGAAAVWYALRPDWRPLPGFRRELASFALRGHLGAVAPVDSLRLDQAAVALFLSPVALGLYTVAYAFTNFPRIVAENAGRIALPMVARRVGSSGARRLVWKFFWGVTLFNLPLTIALLVAMPWLIRVFFGAEFAEAGTIARILLCGTTLVASRRILVEGLRGLGQPSASTVSEVSMYPLLVVAAPVAIRHYGATGLAVALTASYGLSLAVALFTALRGPRPRRQIAPALARRTRAVDSAV